MRPYLSIMMKPASGLCNMRCKYCFYADETSKRDVKSYGMMSSETLENVLKKSLAECSRLITIAFQGGEPSLAGLPFFERVVELTKKYNVNRCEVELYLKM